MTKGRFWRSKETRELSAWSLPSYRDVTNKGRQNNKQPHGGVLIFILYIQLGPRIHESRQVQFRRPGVSYFQLFWYYHQVRTVQGLS
jgi:hypothetical protein